MKLTCFNCLKTTVFTKNVSLFFVVGNLNHSFNHQKLNINFLMFLVERFLKNLAAEGAEVGEKPMNRRAMTSVKPKTEAAAGSSLSCGLIFPGVSQNIAEEQEQNAAKWHPALLNQ